MLKFTQNSLSRLCTSSDHLRQSTTNLCTSPDHRYKSTTILTHSTYLPSPPLSSLISQFHLLTHHSAIMFASSVPCLASLRTDDQVSVLTDTVPIIAAYRQVGTFNQSDLIPTLVSRLKLNLSLNQFLISLHGCKFCL